MPDPTSPVEAALSLTKDTVVTLTDETGRTYKGRVGSVTNHKGGSTSVWVKHDTEWDAVASLDISPDHDEALIRPIDETPPQAEYRDLTSVETHGIRVDWDEPVRTSESGLTYVVDCDECGGLMSRNGQHWPRSSESYGCHDCDHTGYWRRASDAVRPPTRREWAEYKLTDPRPFVSIAERYIPDGYDLPGYYFREACKADPTHYTRCRTSETGSANFYQFNDIKIGVCTKCGAETTARTKTYENGLDEWGEPEDHGTRLPADFVDAIDAVRTGEVALFIPQDRDDDPWGYTYEGISYTCPWPKWDDGVFIIADDDSPTGLHKDIVGAGGIQLGASSGTDLGKVAYWFKNTDDAELVPLDEYERRTNAPTA